MPGFGKTWIICEVPECRKKELRHPSTKLCLDCSSGSKNKNKGRKKLYKGVTGSTALEVAARLDSKRRFRALAKKLGKKFIDMEHEARELYLKTYK